MMIISGIVVEPSIITKFQEFKVCVCRIILPEVQQQAFLSYSIEKLSGSDNFGYIQVFPAIGQVAAMVLLVLSIFFCKISEL